MHREFSSSHAERQDTDQWLPLMSRLLSGRRGTPPTPLPSELSVKFQRVIKRFPEKKAEIFLGGAERERPERERERGSGSHFPAYEARPRPVAFWRRKSSSLFLLPSRWTSRYCRAHFRMTVPRPTSGAWRTSRRLGSDLQPETAPASGCHEGKGPR